MGKKKAGGKKGAKKGGKKASKKGSGKKKKADAGNVVDVDEKVEVHIHGNTPHSHCADRFR